MILPLEEIKEKIKDVNFEDLAKASGYSRQSFYYFMKHDNPTYKMLVFLSDYCQKHLTK